MGDVTAGLGWPTNDIGEAAEALRHGDISAAELVEAHLDRIDHLDGELNACVTVMADEARRAALDADARRRDGDESALLGVPLAVKDNFETAGVVTTCGSPSLAEHVPARDAVVVERLRAAGAALVAKVNLDEFAFGGDSANPVAGPTRNPWDAVSVPGGSSGGSGTAVAAGMCMGATASDTGGSIRNPSAWCGVAGLKPTFGAIDPAGVIPLAWSLDTPGYLARTCADLAVLFAETADRFRDASRTERQSFVATASQPPADRPRVGVVVSSIDDSESEAQPPLRTAVDQLAGVADLEDVALPRPDDALAAFSTIIMAEGSAAWEAGLRGSWDRFGPPVRALLDAGRLIRATEYLHAQRVRESLRREVGRLFDGLDAIVMPCMGISPRPDPFDATLAGPDSAIWRLAVRFTSLWNLTGSPVTCVPCGFTGRGRPVSMQVVTRPGADHLALRIGALAEATWDIPRTALVPTWVGERYPSPGARRELGGDDRARARRGHGARVDADPRAPADLALRDARPVGCQRRAERSRHDGRGARSLPPGRRWHGGRAVGGRQPRRPRGPVRARDADGCPHRDGVRMVSAALLPGRGPHRPAPGGGPGRGAGRRDRTRAGWLGHPARDHRRDRLRQDLDVGPRGARPPRRPARAQVATGLALTTHSIGSPIGLWQLDVFEAEGVDPTRVVIGHADSYPFLDHLLTIVRRGAFVQFDKVGNEAAFFTREDRLLRLILDLIEHGFIGQILLSQDICFRSELKTFGGRGYDYIATTFTERLLAAGLTPDDIAQLLERNPQRMLAPS